jgi:hypothetical protein
VLRPFAGHRPSLLLPASFDSPMGGTASADAQRCANDLWIEEAATITVQKSAFRLMWDQIGSLGGLNFRVAAQSYNTYTDTAAVLGGGNALQRTCDSAISLARGKNTLTADVYRTDATDRGWGLSGLWIINYKCAKPTNGWGRANRTCIWSLLQYGTGNFLNQIDISATAPAIPEASYYLSCVGIEFMTMFSGNTQTYGYNILVERLSGEGVGHKWERAYLDASHTDTEVGVRFYRACIMQYFERYPGDPEASRFDLETSRQWRIHPMQIVAVLGKLLLYYTYHALTFSVSGTVTGSGGGTVNLYLFDDTDKTLLLTGSRSGNGAYTLTWYDSARNVFVDAREDGTHLGRSEIGVATGTP